MSSAPPFLVCIHDATPAYIRETRAMIRDLAPLVGRRLSFGVVPNWRGAWPLAGYPVQDVRVVVYDGKHHPVDSKEVAFVTAGKKAFIDAMLKARPIMLEPVVNIEITVQDHHMGDITGDLSSKRGQVSGTNSVGGGTVTIAGQVPLSELSGYQTRLNSVTGGHGSYTLELSHYDAVPPGVQKTLMEAYKPKVEE